MKHCALICLGVFALNAVAFADESGFPAEMLGTWASTPGDCKHKGESTIRITGTAVETIATHGDIISSGTAGNLVIEVLFTNPIRGASGKNVRIYKLSTDGKLMEIWAGKVVATRTRCEVPAN